jgi:phosphoribosylaminoimidazole carboxylase (NCAIR synthetase)
MSFIYDKQVSNRFPHLGVIGAGPLARMLLTPATALGIELHFFAAGEQDSAAQVALHTIGDNRNFAQLIDFAGGCDLLTFVGVLNPAPLARSLEGEGVKVYPSSAALEYTHGNGVQEISDFDSEISVLVARSPHGQSTSWAPTELIRENGKLITTVTPARNISSKVAELAQKTALEMAQTIAIVGVMTVEMQVKGEEISVSEISIGLHESANWSIEGAVTSQYEQHLRAILDLPLGSPELIHEYVVTSQLVAGEKNDMYRPYLHLMARNPRLRFHQYRNDLNIGQAIGHVTAYGKDLLNLLHEVEHARDYFSGAIDE